MRFLATGNIRNRAMRRVEIWRHFSFSGQYSSFILTNRKKLDATRIHNEEVIATTTILLVLVKRLADPGPYYMICCMYAA